MIAGIVGRGIGAIARREHVLHADHLQVAIDEQAAEAIALAHLQAVLRECRCRIVLAGPEHAARAASLGLDVYVIEDASLSETGTQLQARLPEA
ncbi:hypothetical protein, partial [Burkholderia anthina]|uniref:hypothetical protein n=1 Tax=Burkholderia anthina TaxID=179879 RepID=UPI0015889942